MVVAVILMPSVDAVSCHYPLTLAALLPPGCNVFDLVSRRDRWFADHEEIALACLDGDFRPGLLEERLDGTPPLVIDAEEGRHCRPLPAHAEAHARWDVEITASGWSVADLWPAVLDRFVGDAFRQFSLWWTTGSDHVSPCLHVYRGLPLANSYAALLRERVSATDLRCAGAICSTPTSQVLSRED